MASGILLFVVLAVMVVVAIDRGPSSIISPTSTWTNAGTYETHDIGDICFGSINRILSLGIDKAALVYSYNASDYKYRDTSCAVTFQANTLVGRIYVKAEKLSLGTSLVCIKLWDGGFSNSMYTDASEHQHCGNAPFDLDLATTQEYLTVVLTTSNNYEDVTFRLVITPLTTDCTNSNTYRCVNGDCIKDTLQSDGHQNCPDNSDEKDVPNAPCGSNLLTCSASGKCIASSSKCDWLVDCPDSSDEQHCVYKCLEDDPHGYERLQCLDGNGCYYENSRCSDYNDCADGSDNMDCDSCTPRYGDYSNSMDYCSETRTCLVADQFCNGVQDCPSGFDEDYNTCHPSIYWYWTSGQLAGVFIGFIIFVVVVIGAVVLVHKKCQKHVV